MAPPVPRFPGRPISNNVRPGPEDPGEAYYRDEEVEQDLEALGRELARRSGESLPPHHEEAAHRIRQVGPDDEARQKISVVQERLIKEYGYDEHSAKEALSYVTTLLAQE